VTGFDVCAYRSRRSWVAMIYLVLLIVGAITAENIPASSGQTFHLEISRSIQALAPTVCSEQTHWDGVSSPESYTARVLR
jgi:hypothetical protein